MKHHISHLDSRRRRSYGPNFDAAYSFYHAQKVAPGGRLYDTLNPFKEARREAVAAEVNNRISAAGDNRPTDFRLSAFDLFTNWLAKELTDEHGQPTGVIWRQTMRETYRKCLAHIYMYRIKAAKQYAAGYREKPAFLNS